MQDFSFPGNGPAPVMREYRCAWPLGCDHTEWFYVPPSITACAWCQWRKVRNDRPV